VEACSGESELRVRGIGVLHLPGGTSELVETMMGPNKEVWPMLLLSVGVAVVAAWIGDLIGTVAILAGIAGAILLG
jgi:hypothetical protein